YSAVRDDHPYLLDGELNHKSRAIAEACVTFEEWANLFLDAKSVRLDSGPRNILLHGHCHQKALVGMEPSIELLSKIPHSEIIPLDSGCCGMAGSFGYEKEHYEISRAIGDRKLFPAVRDSGADSVVVAPGFSCRHQIKHFTGKDAVSSMVLLAKLLRD
ncbi:MAG: (Fe-S)-binding protein, partial [bacterium]